MGEVWWVVIKVGESGMNSTLKVTGDCVLYATEEKAKKTIDLFVGKENKDKFRVAAVSVDFKEV